jgi:LAO/AO transport system kinase
LKNRHSKIDYIEGILQGDRQALSKTITLIESTLADDIKLSEEIINEIATKVVKSIKIGITGSPGAGKSTLIEVFGNYLTGLGKKVAVLAIDPTSSISKGSILGDKTRMQNLANNPLAYIRPSPSSEYLGGTNFASREIIMLCEAAGYELILIETVGVGQSESLVRSMVDYFLLLSLAGSGDELQGIKKGILEHADGILITKADGENIENAKKAKNELENAFHYFDKSDIKINIFSAENICDVENLWATINEFVEKKIDDGTFQSQRNLQQIDWMHEILKRKIVSNFYEKSKNIATINELEGSINSKLISVYDAVNQLINNQK